MYFSFKCVPDFYSSGWTISITVVKTIAVNRHSHKKEKVFEHSEHYFWMSLWGRPWRKSYQSTRRNKSSQDEKLKNKQKTIAELGMCGFTLNLKKRHCEHQGLSLQVAETLMKLLAMSDTFQTNPSFTLPKWFKRQNEPVKPVDGMNCSPLASVWAARWPPNSSF